MSPWKVILATMVIFACGVVTGGLMTRTVATHAEAPQAGASNSFAVATNSSGATNRNFMAGPILQMQRIDFLKRMDKSLDLTPAQHDEIAKIMRASQERTQPLWNQMSPQMNEELKRVREDIRDVLTPDQRRKFLEMLRRGRKADGAQGTNRFRAD